MVPPTGHLRVPKRTQVWVLLIETKHGTDVTVHATEDSAYKEAANFAREWWERDHPEDPAPPIPDDDAEVVHSYFADNEFEFYSIDQYEVLP